MAAVRFARGRGRAAARDRTAAAVLLCISAAEIALAAVMLIARTLGSK